MISLMDIFSFSDISAKNMMLILLCNVGLHIGHKKRADFRKDTFRYTVTV